MVDINFLSEEDLDLQNLSREEITVVWCAWFDASQATNMMDADHFSHACFGETMPEPISIASKGASKIVSPSKIGE